MLNEAQRATLAAHIRASTDQAVVDALAIRNDTELTRLYNLDSALWWVWRTLVTQDEIMTNGFDWVEVDNLTAGKARIWEWLFDNAQSAIRPSLPNVRAGIAECWKGTAAKLAVQAAVLAKCKRHATLAESLFVTGSGTENDPALLVVEGAISTEDVGRALNDNP
jgi:hypothetical protein